MTQPDRRCWRWMCQPSNSREQRRTIRYTRKLLSTVRKLFRTNCTTPTEARSRNQKKTLKCLPCFRETAEWLSRAISNLLIKAFSQSRLDEKQQHMEAHRRGNVLSFLYRWSCSMIFPKNSSRKSKNLPVVLTNSWTLRRKFINFNFSPLSSTILMGNLANSWILGKKVKMEHPKI